MKITIRNLNFIIALGIFISSFHFYGQENKTKTRYVDEIFSEVKETPNVTYSTGVPIPKSPDDLINIAIESQWDRDINAVVLEHELENIDLKMDIF